MRTAPDPVTLEVFLAAIELGSVTRAASRCGLVPSAAAKRIRLLEARYDVKLLERGARGVRPTTAGQALAQHAQALQGLAARIEGDMRAFATGGTGTARMEAAHSAMAGHGLAAGLAGFARIWPGIQLDFREELSLAILQHLAEGLIDLGIITVAGGVPEGCEARPWREDRLLVVLPAQHALAERASLRFAEILDQPLIRAVSGGAVGLRLEEQAQHLGRTLRYRASVASLDACRQLVAAGLAWR